MRLMDTWSPRRKRASLILLMTALLAIASVAWVVPATNRAAFCDSCHEMTPFYAEWSGGPHAEVECVACHVDPGAAAQIAHKFVALREVYLHFTGEYSFPGDAGVPDARCMACHDDVDPQIRGFDHEEHRAERACISCHQGTGHSVSREALAEAGILDEAAFDALETSATADQGLGAADIPDHIAVSCSSCHAMAATGCATCHQRPADHPSQRPACTTCHSATTWRFTHPTPESECTQCHDAPESHPAGTCATCHETGAGWAFTHPDSADCDSCHQVPAGHYGNSCAGCHSPDAEWGSAVFVHPSSSSACLQCHSKPANHYSTTCSSCHRTGVSWTFVHPGSTSCASCHQAPANHYGTSCASCHSPSASWSSATFSHPRIPGGEHTYRSFSCATCHPGGYSTYSCLQCHSSNTPDDDDD